MVGKASHRRRLVLWSACLAVLLPLAALLAFQYRWLVRLERTSTVARLATLDNYAGAVVKEVEYAYVQRAERSLNVPSYLFRHDCLGDVGRFFRRKNVDGVKRFFVVTYLDEFPGSLYFYSPASGEMEPDDGDGEAAAVHLATAGWQGPRAGSRASLGGFYVGDLDHDRPVIFNPIRNSDGQLVGLAGMVVDREHFERCVLPAAISRSLPPLTGRDRLSATVRDAEGRVVYPAGGGGDPGPAAVERELAFVFAGWRFGLRGAYASPGEWARDNFVVNVSLSVFLAVVLLGGVILALRTAAREMRLSEMKSDFVSNVSHELKTPLASIRVFGELMHLGRVRDDGRIREFGAHIENESRRLSRLVDNILDFSKIDSGRRVYRFAPAAVEDAVTEAMRAHEVALSRRGVEIAFTPPAVPLPRLEIDVGALAQAVSNLLDNAVKYSGGRAPEIAVRLLARSGEAVVEVSDRGIGIAPAERQRIFERFHRVGTGLVHDVKGSGLGLAIVRHVVEAHGGRVTVESEPGRGSTFAIHLPLERRAGAASGSAAQELRSRRTAYRGAS